MHHGTLIAGAVPCCVNFEGKLSAAGPQWTRLCIAQCLAGGLFWEWPGWLLDKLPDLKKSKGMPNLRRTCGVTATKRRVAVLETRNARPFGYFARNYSRSVENEENKIYLVGTKRLPVSRCSLPSAVPSSLIDRAKVVVKRGGETKAGDVPEAPFYGCPTLQGCQPDLDDRHNNRTRQETAID